MKRKINLTIQGEVSDEEALEIAANTIRIWSSNPEVLTQGAYYLWPHPDPVKVRLGWQVSTVTSRFASPVSRWAMLIKEESPALTRPTEDWAGELYPGLVR